MMGIKLTRDQYGRMNVRDYFRIMRPILELFARRAMRINVQMMAEMMAIER
jgi:hypothetical protein